MPACLAILSICWTNELKAKGSHFEASCAGVFRDTVCAAQERNSWRTRTLLKLNNHQLDLIKVNSAMRNLTQSNMKSALINM
jgi:hypothetical protein